MKHFFGRVLIAGVALLKCFIPEAHLFAQFPQVIFSQNDASQKPQFTTLLQLVSFEKDNFTIAEGTVNFLGEPIPFPRVVLSDDNLPPSFGFVSQIPKRSRGLFSASDSNITAALKLMSTKLEVGDINRTPEEKAEVEQFKATLFLPSGGETSGYKAYRNYVKLIEELDEKLKSKTLTSSERAQLEIRKQKEQDRWKERPDGIKVETAVLRFKQYDTSEEKQTLLAWRSDLAKPTSPLIPLHLISDPSGWRTALGSNTNDAPLIVRSLEQNSTPQSIPLHHGQFKLFFQHRVIPVKHAFLKQELLSSRLWTLGGALLSNGKDDDDKGELLPRFVSHIIVAKDIQISFTNNDLWDIIADLVVKHPSIDIAGLKITPEFSYVTPNTIIVSRPMIIGVVIKELPPTPNPDPALIK